MARFFIDRPIFAWVIALLIVLAGILSIAQLPIAQYPNVAPPSISVSANYAGASAEILQDTVTSVIEQQMVGIDNLIYFSSTSNNSGQSTITLYFKPGTDSDIAQVQVQNKLQLAFPRLPLLVQREGVTVFKSTRNYLMFFSLSSTDGSLDDIQLGNYIYSHILDPIARISGVGDAHVFGTQNAMRVWLDPDKLYSFNLSAGEVIEAIRAQNAQIPYGQLGGLPSTAGQQLNVTIGGRASLRTVEEFENIKVKVEASGAAVLLKDIGRVEMGGEDYSVQARINGRPSAAVAIRLTPTANAIATADAIYAKVEELSQFFPPNVRVDYPLDQSVFIRISIREVVETLLTAILLVFLVIYLFLQNIRATFIPAIVVPIALCGTFTVMQMLGFSINVLTLFGMVMAIGILVDDAIVVVENVERIMHQEGLSPREASHKAMDQIVGALIGISLVLTAVFIPMAFFGGAVGAVYRQFSLALVASMLFSVFLALSLTPALCASLLKPIDPKGHANGFSGWFHRMFGKMADRYQALVKRVLNHTVLFFIAYLAIVAVCVILYWRLPSAFLPEEDQGYFLTNISLPVGATQLRTEEVLKQVEEYYIAQTEVDQIITVAGFSFDGPGQNSALAFVRLKDWDERIGEEHSAQAMIRRATTAFADIKDALIYPANMPPIPELGTTSGFLFELQDRSGKSHDKLMEASNRLLDLASTNPELDGVRLQGLEDTPEVNIKVDEEKAMALGVSIANLNTLLQTHFASIYIDNFVHGNRVQRVIIQGDAPYRMKPEDINNIYVNNSKGEMVPLSTFTTLEWGFGPPQVQHYNGFPSLEFVGNAAPGKSSGEAMAAMEKIMKQLPHGFGYEWSGQSYEEKIAGSQAPLLYSLSVLVVFLALAALYESWSIPFAVILVVPLGIIGSLLAANFRGLPDDVYFKVGLLAIVGLSTKNAILIVEFAKDLHAQGKGLIEATLEAAHLRLRPILMTSMAFIMGVLPLAFSQGAGSASQHDIGTGVTGGMLTATVLAIFFVPFFFVSVFRLLRKTDE